MGCNTRLFPAAIAIVITLAAPAARAAPADACALLTAAQVGAVLGGTAQAGTPIMPTDHKVCTWRAADGASWVTLMLQTPQAANSGRQLGTVGSIVVTSVSGLGDGAYYLAVGDQVGLIVKKGGAAFKVAVYKHGPVAGKEAGEKVLAGEILSRM